LFSLSPPPEFDIFPSALYTVSMKALVQRVSSASVRVDDKLISRIENGLLIFLGIVKGDTEKDFNYIIEKVSKLRIFEDTKGRMNLSVMDIAGEALVVSQFTLAADTRKGNRPSFINAEDPDVANDMYEKFIAKLSEHGINTFGGSFGAMMDVELVNDGPVTIMIDSTN
jgi:D-tyrosyl-tRNA(Tyr) deacylase